MELAEWLGEARCERLELVGVARVEAGFPRRSLIGEWRERCERLAYPRPTQRPLVAVVVGRVDALGLFLDTRDCLDRAAILRGDAGSSSVQALPAASGGAPVTLYVQSHTLVTSFFASRSYQVLLMMPLTAGMAPLMKMLCPTAVTVGDCA